MMNSDSWKLAERFVPATYIKQAEDASRSRQNRIRQLLYHKKIPENGLDDLTIELLLHELSGMDSNNFSSNSGVGEREARCASELVAKRHYHFGHGIGRSGDLMEPQPKAAGSSLMYSITNCLVKDLVKTMGITSDVECFVIPVATGMALALSMITLRSRRPQTKYVIWSRIDQKSCFKSILTAGLIPVMIDTVRKEDQLVTNIPHLEAKIKEIGPENITCVMSTTSCFAPRACDKIEVISALCKQYDVPHLVNNAYGLQSSYLMKRLQKAHGKGRIDIFVQSTDKNLLVPVGGAIICSFSKSLLKEVAKMYPGRASSTPIMDVFITLLSLGKTGYNNLATERIQMYNYLSQRLKELADQYKEKVLNTDENPLSLAMSLSTVSSEHLTKLGSMLFLRTVSGTRVVTTFENKTIGGYDFKGWGSHSDKDNEGPYLTAAAAIGIKKTDVDLFMTRLEKVFNELISNGLVKTENSVSNTKAEDN